MSKASKWVVAFQAVEQSRMEMDLGDDACVYVTEDGKMGIAVGHTGVIHSAKVPNALALAAWIIDTFGDTPANPEEVKA